MSTPTSKNLTVTLQGQDPGIIAIERALIGGCLSDGRGTKSWPMTIQPREFFLERHRMIWTALLGLAEHTEHPDVLALSEALRKTGKLAEVGGPATLAEMANEGAFDLDYYGTLVRDAATTRAKVEFGAKLAANPGMSVTEVEKALRVLDSSIGATAGDPLVEFLTERERIETSPPLLTGLGALDAKTYGVSLGQVITIGGRTSHGKTSFCTFVAQSFAKRGVSVDYLSLEERRPDIIAKWVSQRTGIPVMMLLRGHLDETDRLTAEQAAKDLKGLPLQVLTIRSHAEADVIAAVAASRAQVVFVDHVQQIMTPDPNRAYAIERLMNRLAAIAVADNKVIFVAAQINRVIDTTKAAPDLNDLRDSGALEHVPRQVWFTYWPYKHDQKRAMTDFELIIAKAAVGPVGPVPMTWQPACARFDAEAAEEVPDWVTERHQQGG